MPRPLRLVGGAQRTVCAGWKLGGGGIGCKRYPLAVVFAELCHTASERHRGSCTLNTSPEESVLQAATELRTSEFVLRPIREADAESDYDAVMESKEFLRAWEQTGWPEDDFTIEANREDVVRLERRHDAGESFTYTVESRNEGRSLGCVYVFPTSAPLFSKARIASIRGAAWHDFEVAVYFWVRQSMVADGFDRSLISTLDEWLRNDWRVDSYLAVTSQQAEQQVDLLEATGRVSHFELTYENKTGKELAYAWPSARST